MGTRANARDSVSKGQVRMSLKELKQRYYQDKPLNREPPKKARTQGEGNDKHGLLHYFRDMAHTALLTPEREVELAQAIEAKETDLWAEILSFAPSLEHLLAVIEICQENS